MSYKYLQLNTLVKVFIKRRRDEQVAVANFVVGLYVVLPLFTMPSHRAGKSQVKIAGPNKSLSPI